MTVKNAIILTKYFMLSPVILTLEWKNSNEIGNHFRNFSATMVQSVESEEGGVFTVCSFVFRGSSQPLRHLITVCSFVFRRSLPTPTPHYYCMLLCVKEVPPNPYAPLLLYAPLCSGGSSQPLRHLITVCSFVFRRSLPTPTPHYYGMLLCVKEVPPNPYAPLLLYAPLCSGGSSQPLRPLITLCSLVFRRALPTPTPLLTVWSLVFRRSDTEVKLDQLKEQEQQLLNLLSRHIRGTSREISQRCGIPYTYSYICLLNIFWFFFSGSTSKREGLTSLTIVVQPLKQTHLFVCLPSRFSQFIV